MHTPETFSSLLARMNVYKPIVWVGISEADAQALTIIQTVSTWSDKAADTYPTWPVVGVPLPVSRDVPQVGDISVQTSAVSDTRILVVERVHLYPAKVYIRVTAYPRTPDADYWPPEAACVGLVETWATLLEAEALTHVGKDCDTGPDVSPACHWLSAKRRYGLKNNQTCRMLFVCGLDPEGRHRCNPWHPMPAHMERALRMADGLAGLRMGVALAEMSADDLYASGGVLPEEEILAALRAYVGA